MLAGHESTCLQLGVDFDGDAMRRTLQPESEMGRIVVSQNGNGWEVEVSVHTAGLMLGLPCSMLFM